VSLTRTDGPLAPHPPRTVNYTVDGPAHKLLAHPFPRRVRAEFAGRTVLDTRAGILLHETALLPRFYVPHADLDASAFVASEHTTHCPFKGGATYHHLRVGERSVDDALWSYPEPVAAVPWLAGYASLYWHAADAWFDEEDQVFAHLTDPYTRVDIRATSRHVQVLAGDTVLAQSRRALVLHETGLPARWYLPPEDVLAQLVPTETSHRCPYKGRSSYWTARLADGREIVDAAWSYPDPLPESSRIAGWVSFDHDELSVLVDDRPC